MVQNHTQNLRPWLEAILREKCNLPLIRSFQLDHGLDLIAGRDLFLVISPGMGKTTVMLAPLLAAQERGESAVAIIVVPTKLLGDQQAQVAASRGLRALPINEDSVREAYYNDRNLLAELAAGKDVRVAVMSPQMLRSDRVRALLRQNTFRRVVRWFFIDEVHLVDEGADEWRVAFNDIKFMRVLLPDSTIWGGFTGTITPSRALVVAKQLGFRSGAYINARYSVDRPHVKYIPRFIQHPSSKFEFLDLSFLVAPTTQSSDDIPRTFVFCDTIELGWRVMSFLDTLIPPPVLHRGQLVRLYNSLMPRDYRREFMEDIREGVTLRIGVCTDTCTYGLDVPNIKRVVIFGLRPMPENMAQQIGRAGRDGHPVVAYTFAPPFVREVQPDENQTAQAKEDAEKRSNLPSVVRQWFNPTINLCPRQAYLLYMGENNVTLPNPCCSLHHPEPEQSNDLELVTHWAEILGKERHCNTVPRSDGTHRALEPHMRKSLVQMLGQWRDRQWGPIRGSDRNRMSCEFLSTSMINRLADKGHICTSLDRLKTVIGNWRYFDSHGSNLLAFLGAVMSGFDEIFEERSKEDSEDVPIVDQTVEAQLEDRSEEIIRTAQRVRLVLRDCTAESNLAVVVPAKRGSDTQRGDGKRARRGKENKI